MDESVVLKALKFYREKVQKDFDKLDAIVNGNHASKLIDVLKEAQEITKKPDWYKTHGSRLKSLSIEEKRLRAAIKKSCESATNDKWLAARLELDELSREISNIEFRERVRA